MQVIGGALYAAAIVALGRWPSLDGGVVVAGTVLGVIGVVTLAALYRALALGPMSVVSPVTAAYLVVTVTLAVIFLGDRLSGVQLVAMAVTFAGVVLASTDLRTLSETLGRPLPGVRLALVCVIGFGVWQTLFAHFVREHDGLALILIIRIASALVLMGAFLVRRPTPARIDRSAVALVTTVGAFDTLANLAFFLGFESGFASIVATGSGAYPVIPAVLAIVFLRERLAPNQYLGVAVIVAGLVGLGLAA